MTEHNLMTQPLPVLINQLQTGQNLSAKAMGQAFHHMMTGQAKLDDMVTFLKTLAEKGETSEELTGAASVMRQHANKIIAPDHAMDIVGTGGDMKGSLNISTATAFVVAGAGVVVAKHGNRAITSRAGTADVQFELGINIDCPLELVQTALDQVGFTFLFAPKHHQATKHVMPARKLLAEQKIKTIFNILGPLTNPALVKNYLIGVYDKKWLKPMAQALHNLGAMRAYLVHGFDGLDEVSISGDSYLVTLNHGKITELTIHPNMAKLPTYPLSQILGGDVTTNADQLKKLLQHQANDFNLAFRDAVLWNAAVALTAIGRVNDYQTGKDLAQAVLESGKAWQKYLDFRQLLQP